jgi:hypothetical protein
MSVSDSDSFVLYMANDSRSENPLKLDASHDVMGARPQLGANKNSVLFSSDPNLLQSWRAESNQKYLSASLETLPISSTDTSPSCSVTNLPQLGENGKRRKSNGFFPVRPKPQALGLKRDRRRMFSSLPSLFSASNVPKRSRLSFTAGEKESKEKLKQKEEIFLISKSHRVTQPTDMNHKERLQTVDTSTSADIVRNQGMAQTHTAGPQEAVAGLCDIQWDFSECKQMPPRRFAAFELTSPLHGDKKLLQHHSRPDSGSANIRKFL